MRNIALALIVATAIPITFLGCRKKQQQQQQYPQQYQQPYPQQYPQQTTPAATPAPAPVPATGGDLSAPGPAAIPCQTDATCVTAKCHPQYQKCVFPCQKHEDCVPPNQCIMGTGVCAPPIGAPAPTTTP